MKAFLLVLAYGLAIPLPLSFALCSRPRRVRSGDAQDAQAAADTRTPEEVLVETVESLASALRGRGEKETAERLLNAFYGASTGSEMVMGLRWVLRGIDRRRLQGDVGLLMELERLLS